MLIETYSIQTLASARNHQWAALSVIEEQQEGISSSYYGASSVNELRQT